MSHPFVEKLAHIRETLLRMSSLTDQSLTKAVRALMERDSALAAAVEADDAEIDSLERRIDNMVITHMATHGPMASDSRLMLAVSKISSNLERIGDQATTIARRTRALVLEPPLGPLMEVPAMAQVTVRMLNDALDAFVNGNCQLAIEIIPRDKEVDELNRCTAKGLIQLMKENPAHIVPAVDLLTVSKAIERAADHAKSIAETVVYLYRGEDVRHEKNLRSA